MSSRRNTMRYRESRGISPGVAIVDRKSERSGGSMLSSNAVPINPVSTQVFPEVQAMLDDLVSNHWGLRFVCLSSVDGRVVSFAGIEGMNPQRLAAISSSSLGLSESFAKEAVRSSSRYSVVVAEQGAVITVRVPTTSARYAVSLCDNGSETLAMLLRRSLDTADALATMLP